MTHVLDEPQIDTRPPGFGCGHSFGMLGPTRLVLLPSTVPESHAAYAGGFCLPWVAAGSGSPFWWNQWKCELPDVSVSVFLSLLDPRTGWWRVNCDINATPPSSSGGATREFTNFTWQFPILVLSDDIGPNWSNCSVYRIGEWQTVTRRFPDVSFPEE